MLLHREGTLLTDHTITELLTAWRDAERALEAETQAARRRDLAAVVESLREEYHRAVDAVAAGSGAWDEQSNLERS